MAGCELKAAFIYRMDVFQLFSTLESQVVLQQALFRTIITGLISSNIYKVQRLLRVYSLGRPILLPLAFSMYIYVSHDTHIMITQGSRDDMETADN